MKISEVSKTYGISHDLLLYYEEFVMCRSCAGMPIESLCRYLYDLDEGKKG